MCRRAKSMTTTAKNRITLTAKGLEDLKKELEELKERLTELEQEIKDSKELAGADDSEEGYGELDEQKAVKDRIWELEKVISHAYVSETHTADKVELGSKVKVNLNGEKDEFTVVDSVEANPAKKKISSKSPIGQALLGAKVGDTLEVQLPTQTLKCKILAIS